MNTVTIDKKKFVLVPEAEYRKLTRHALGPAADAQGNRPAVAFANATIAQSIVRDRQAVRLSQKQLAERAGIRVEILNRAERGVTVPSVRTLSKIEDALRKAGLKRG